MERLLADAEKISGIEYDISSYADIVDAIHVIQEEMGIAGTTAKEASETIAGSLNAARSAWQNLVTGIADDNADFSTLVDNFVDSVSVAANNILPRVGIALEGVGQLIDTLFPVIMQKIPQIIGESLPMFLEAALTVIETLVDSITQNSEQMVEGAISLVLRLLDGIIEMLPEIIEAGITIVIQLGIGLIKAIPDMVARIPEIIVAIVNGLSDGIAQIKQVGKDFIAGLWNGMKEGAQGLYRDVQGIISNIKSKFTSSSLGFNIHSPSKWSEGVGNYIMEGLGIGLANSAGKVYETIEDIVAEIKSRFKYVKDVVSLNADIANLQYDLWELQGGKNASDVEKYMTKLALLNDELSGQESVVEAAYAAYQKVVEQYGEGSDESKEYQKTLLQESIAYEKLKASIEEATEAQKRFKDASNVSATRWSTSTVNFADSGIGKSTTATAGILQGSSLLQKAVSATINLVTPDGKKISSAILPDLLNVAKANGTPIANPT